jgi:hypothetical protein
MRRTLLIPLLTATLLVAPLLITTGCAERRPGVTRTGGGAFPRMYAASPDAVHAAAERVIRKLDLMMIESGPEGSSAYRIVARNAQDTRVNIYIRPAGIESTEASVKVQPGWNEGFSIRILQMINDELR